MQSGTKILQYRITSKQEQFQDPLLRKPLHIQVTNYQNTDRNTNVRSAYFTVSISIPLDQQLQMGKHRSTQQRAATETTSCDISLGKPLCLQFNFSLLGFKLTASRHCEMEGAWARAISIILTYMCYMCFSAKKTYCCTFVFFKALELNTVLGRLKNIYFTVHVFRKASGVNKP